MLIYSVNVAFKIYFQMGVYVCDEL